MICNPQIHLVHFLFNLIDGNAASVSLEQRHVTGVFRRPDLKPLNLNKNSKPARLGDSSVKRIQSGSRGFWRRFCRQCTCNASRASVMALVEGQMAAPARLTRG